jgi:hypothetical protein
MTGMLTGPPPLTRTQRRMLVTLHVALSVGWLGASMAMLTLALATAVDRVRGRLRQRPCGSSRAGDQLAEG